MYVMAAFYQPPDSSGGFIQENDGAPHGGSVTWTPACADVQRTPVVRRATNDGGTAVIDSRARHLTAIGAYASVASEDRPERSSNLLDKVRL